MREKHLLTNYLLLVCSISLLFLACSKEPETQDFINIEDQYELQIHQTLTADGGQPSLHISSVEPHECTNSYISYQALMSNEKLRLFLNDILIEGECIQGNEIVSEEILMVSSDESLPIEISLKNVIRNHGTLHIDNVEFDLQLSKFDGLKISKTRINRILPKMMWGSYSIENKEVEHQIASYLDELNNNSMSNKGDYGYFYVAQDNSISIYGADDNNDQNMFFITNSENIEAFELQFLEFKQLDPSLTLQATNFDGSTVNIQ